MLPIYIEKGDITCFHPQNKHPVGLLTSAGRPPIFFLVGDLGGETSINARRRIASRWASAEKKGTDVHRERGPKPREYSCSITILPRSLNACSIQCGVQRGSTRVAGQFPLLEMI
jgi:hypothetical protein